MGNDVLVEIGRSLRRARQARGMTQGQVAAHVGVQVSAVSQWERGQTPPKVEHLAGFLDAVGARWADLDPPTEQTSREDVLARLESLLAELRDADG